MVTVMCLTLRQLRRVRETSRLWKRGFSFTCEWYHNNKYKNSPFYKGALLWDTLPIDAKQCVRLPVFKKLLRGVYQEYNDYMS